MHFTDQLALTGKFNTGRIKACFNLGAEYSNQETDQPNILLMANNTTRLDIQLYKADSMKSCAGWCTYPKSKSWAMDRHITGTDGVQTNTTRKPNQPRFIS